jgi:hypothetical protein
VRRLPIPTAIFAAVVTSLAISAPRAQANLVVDYSLDAGATFHNLVDAASGSSVSGGSPTIGVFGVSLLSIQSNSPGTPNLDRVCVQRYRLHRADRAAESGVEQPYRRVGYDR